MDGSALHHALEARGGLRFGRAIGGQTRQILVEELGQILTAACRGRRRRHAGHGGCIAVVGQTEQQMLQRGVFVPAVGLAKDSDRWSVCSRLRDSMAKRSYAPDGLKDPPGDPFN